jgi:hypothetical protein
MKKITKVFIMTDEFIKISKKTYESLKDQINSLETENNEEEFHIYDCDGDIIYTSTKATNIKECVEEAVDQRVDLSEANLRGDNLHGSNLSGAYLSGADLREADLCGANLSGAYLREADLSGSNLFGANLRGADLCGANLRGADLCGAKFYGKTDTPQILKKDQVEHFLLALGFKIEE